MKHQEVTPYGQSSSKKQQVTDMFDNIAPKYDLLNRVLSLGIDVQWRKKAVSEVKSQQASSILDIATGTGDLAIMFAKDPDIEEVIGLDISSGMLSVARKKAASKSLEHKLSFIEGDSEKLPFANNTFDAVTVAFGVRNFEDTLKGLKECQRVLREGGQLVVLEFTQPTMSPFKQIYHGYFKYILPIIGKITSKDPKAYTYLFESVQAFPSGKDFVSLLENLGFKHATHKPLTLGICGLYSCKK